MASKSKLNPDITRMQNYHLVGYSFDSLTQRNAMHLLNRRSTRPTRQMSEQVEASLAERASPTKATRIGKMLLVGFLFGILVILIDVFIQDDFSSKSVRVLKGPPPVYAPAPALIPAPSTPITTYAGDVQSIPTVVRESPVSPLDAELPQTAPAPAAEAKKHPEGVADDCIGARLAFSLCTSTK